MAIEGIFYYALIFFGGFAAAFFGSMVGGGGLISLPILMMAGIGPQSAVATNKVGGLGLILGGFRKLVKSGKVLWKFVLPLTLLNLAGSYIGANILLSIDPFLLKKLIAVAMIITLPFLLHKPFQDFLLKKRKRKFEWLWRITGGVLYGIIAIYASFIGAGQAIIAFFVLMVFMGMNLIEANATTKIPGFVSRIFLIIFFGLKGLIDYKAAIVLFIAMFIGANVGVSTLLKNGEEWAKKVYIFMAALLALWLLFF